MGANNTVVKRVCVLAEMELQSPAFIGNFDNFESDRDAAVNKDGFPFLSGAALAGVLRGTLDKDGGDKLFGKRIRNDKDETKQSPLWVFDAELKKPGDEPASVIIIDSVSLDENKRNHRDEEEQKLGVFDHMNKIAKGTAKFDMQAVDKGARFDLRLCLHIRENKEENEGLEDLLDKVLSGLNNLYVGGKTSRGFGKLKCSALYKRVFDFTGSDKAEQMTGWLEFPEYPDWRDIKDPNFKLKTENFFKPQDGVTVITAGLELHGSVLIRSIYAVSGDEDRAHTVSAEQSVIYGTSWAGAIRGGLARLLKSNGIDKAETYLDKVFGRQYYDSDGKKDITSPSKIRIDASYFGKDDRKRITYTRVKIDRFTGSAAYGALFTNRPHFGGDCELTFTFKDDPAIKELVLLALDAIDKGLITLGGETAVGRGVFTLKNKEKFHFVGAKTALKEAIANA